MVIVFATSYNKNTKYDEWKDTIMSYGDGTYKILHHYIDDEPVQILTNCRYNQCVMTEIDKYVQKNDCVYFVGYYYNKKIFCKLNIIDNTLFYFPENTDEELIMVYLDEMENDRCIEIYKSFDDFSTEDKSFFLKLLTNK